MKNKQQNQSNKLQSEKAEQVTNANPQEKSPWIKILLFLKSFFVSGKKEEKPKNFAESAVSMLKTIVGAFVVVMIINGLAIASFVVPTGSMENTVMSGDFLFVNKFIYGPSTPQVIPFFNLELPFYKFPGFKSPKRGDVIVFIYPGERDELKATEFQYYLKRCVAEPGDSLKIINKKLYVNGVEYQLPPNGKFETPRQLTPEQLQYIEQTEKYMTFPNGREYTPDNYGPIRIPKKGDVIQLTSTNIREWYVFIKREGHIVEESFNSIYIDNKPATSYIVQEDYCFGMGDNRDNSKDSRFWGFVPVKNVVGTPIVVYWSWDPKTLISPGESIFSIFPNLFSKFATVRWSRILKFIN